MKPAHHGSLRAKRPSQPAERYGSALALSTPPTVLEYHDFDRVWRPIDRSGRAQVSVAKSERLRECRAA